MEMWIAVSGIGIIALIAGLFAAMDTRLERESARRKDAQGVQCPHGLARWRSCADCAREFEKEAALERLKEEASVPPAREIPKPDQAVLEDLILRAPPGRDRHDVSGLEGQVGGPGDPPSWTTGIPYGKFMGGAAGTGSIPPSFVQVNGPVHSGMAGFDSQTGVRYQQSNVEPSPNPVFYFVTDGSVCTRSRCQVLITKDRVTASGQRYHTVYCPVHGQAEIPADKLVAWRHTFGEPCIGGECPGHPGLPDPGFYRVTSVHSSCLGCIVTLVDSHPPVNRFVDYGVHCYIHGISRVIGGLLEEWIPPAPPVKGRVT